MSQATTIAAAIESQEPDTVGGGQGPKVGLGPKPEKGDGETRSGETGTGGEKKETKVGLAGH